jgi:hypothetical protein
MSGVSGRWGTGLRWPHVLRLQDPGGPARDLGRMSPIGPAASCCMLPFVHAPDISIMQLLSTASQRRMRAPAAPGGPRRGAG